MSASFLNTSNWAPTGGIATLLLFRIVYYGLWVTIGPDCQIGAKYIGDGVTIGEGSIIVSIVMQCPSPNLP